MAHILESTKREMESEKPEEGGMGTGKGEYRPYDFYDPMWFKIQNHD